MLTQTCMLYLMYLMLLVGCCSASDAARGVVGGVNEGASTSSMPGPSRAVSPSATPADDEASSANPTGDTSTHWTREQTMLLLSLCQDFKDDLNDPSKRKKNYVAANCTVNAG